ncbi:MAG: Ig-like domain-containing protein [Lewinella sp.]|nr:Ig-like domain-containing protein [Lewinella sp.]
MKQLVFCLILQTLSLTLGAQFTDEFSGADLAGHWLGDTGKFTLNNGELQLDDPDPGSNNTAVLYALAPTAQAATTTWTFYARLVFAPSASNYARIYLTADQPPLPGASVHGYYVQIGGISGSDDAVELYRQDGTSHELLLSGQPGGVGSDPAIVGVSVSRGTDGSWTLETDYSGGEDYEPEGGSIIDNTYPQGLFFGFSCEYTSSRASNFFFDRVLVEPTVSDTDPPMATEVVAETAQQLRVIFNELLEPTSANLTANYSLDQGLGTPQLAVLQADQSSVLLDFAEPLVNFTNYQLTITNITDLSTNVLSSQSIAFQFLLPVVPMSGDLLLTEIMADPSPAVGLPQEEYLELYNASAEPIQLEGLQLSTSSSPRILPPYVLEPDEYLILCPADAEADFAPFGPVLGLTSFPALTNGGSLVSMATAEGDLLFYVFYQDDWYRDPLKADGGFSLELIDPTRDLNCSGNWRASDAGAGGTPGQPNSLLGAELETEPPLLLNTFAPSPTEITLRFDDELDPAILPGQFTISPSIGVEDLLITADLRSLTLVLDAPLQENQLYTVTVAPGLADCLGNATTDTQMATVGLARAPQPGELIINEILFNPYTGGVDFVELRNNSEAILELQGLRLRNEAITSGTVSADVTNPFTLFPDSLVVFTPDPANILANYTVPNPANLVENDLPSLGDDEGNLSVYAPDFTLLDALDYSADWHSPLLNDENGVSLERLRATAATQDAGNWYSAAAAAGYATPTGANSQDRAGIPVVPGQEDFFALPSQTFSPDGDGYQDVLEMVYQTTGPGFLADILIFDAQGRPVRQLQNQDLLAGQGTILWDGADDDGAKARIGIYVILVELFTPTGDTHREKHTCVLAGQLD